MNGHSSSKRAPSGTSTGNGGRDGARAAALDEARLLSPRQAVALAAALIIAASIAVVMLSLPALAVHDDGAFELEGDIADSPANGPDWGSIFDANGNAANLNGGLAGGFAMDDISPAGAVDHTVFTAGGTKNSQQPAAFWRWGTQSVPAKDDLSNVYAYGTVDANGNLLLYAGLERLAPNGASHIDIEFNREAISLDEEPPCDNEPCHFLGNKSVGDILVAMEFENGGALGALRVYQWNGSSYIVVPGAVLTGEGCNAANGIPADVICGFNNDGPADDGGPWPNYDNHGDVITTLPKNAFSEFGVNLTALLGSTPCITSFMAHTRTSPGPQQDDPITSELKDFAGPEPLPLCGIIWEKRNGEGQPLAGATFSVCRTHDGSGADIADECLTVADNQAPDIDSTDGRFDLTIITPGSYEICEISAPSGYILDPNCQTVVVTGAGVFTLAAPFVNTTPTPTPTEAPIPTPTEAPTPTPTEEPSATPTNAPTATPTDAPTSTPTDAPTAPPTSASTATPTDAPTATPTEEPTPPPTAASTATPTDAPTATPTATATPTDEPTPTPTPTSTATPTDEPTPTPTATPTATPTDELTPTPTPTATPTPTDEPTATATDEPTATPADEPTPTPTEEPTPPPTSASTATPTDAPTATPTDAPTPTPTDEPTAAPTEEPTATPTEEPTDEPTDAPTPTPAILSTTGTPTRTPGPVPTRTPVVIVGQPVRPLPTALAFPVRFPATGGAAGPAANGLPLLLVVVLGGTLAAAGARVLCSSARKIDD